MKTGIIFDMDGTLWDSASQVAAAWSRITVPKLGKQVTEDDMYRTMGMPMDELAKAIFPDRELSELLPILEESYQEENRYLRSHGAELYPDLIATLQQLAKTYPLYIVSNCQEGYIEAFLDYYKLEAYFEDFICFGANNRPKGDNIALMIERNHLNQGIYVGDIQADYEAAVAGGAFFIHAAYGFGTIEADVPKLHAFRELPELLKRCPFIAKM
ncbi:Phosphoglycolate phosphatase [Eubacterium plexicaudatum ASF492]|uniref:HAD hydrolase, family IA n=1 Tax=Eubacterium plexicaudatum ASF492 TaxID=1235802 RepID=N2AAM3_9FIRM|nr:Phosphoglycolate phosphatase [Eubacterium plexicaudatum ASF492]